jgi:hypothetical protein
MHSGSPTGTHRGVVDMNQIVRQTGVDSEALPRPGTLLSEALLQRVSARAAGYDRDNRFFHEDREEN